MAASSVNIVMAKAGGKGVAGFRLPAYINGGAGFDTLATPTSSTQSTTPSEPGMIARITPVGGNIYAVAGINPTAVSGSGWLVIDGTTLDLQVKKGEIIAVIDA